MTTAEESMKGRETLEAIRGRNMHKVYECYADYCRQIYGNQINIFNEDIEGCIELFYNKLLAQIYSKPIIAEWSKQDKKNLEFCLEELF